MEKEKNNLIKRAFIDALGTVAYIILVALFFHFARDILGEIKEPNLIVPIIMLMLFVVSATITGALVLGKPILLYLDGSKQDAIKLFIYTLGFLVVALIIAINILAWSSLIFK